MSLRIRLSIIAPALIVYLACLFLAMHQPALALPAGLLGCVFAPLAGLAALECWVMRPLQILAAGMRGKALPRTLLDDPGPLGAAAREASQLQQRIAALNTALAARDRAEVELHARIEQFASISSNLPGIIYRVVLDAQGNMSFPPLALGKAPTSSTPHPQAVHWFDRIHPDDRAAFYEVLHSSAEQLVPFDLEQRVVGGDEHAWVRNISSPQRHPDGSTAWDGIVLDITAQKLSELTLQRSLEEKELLLHEIHHRVKNNLQIIASMLDLQALMLDDPRTQAALLDSQRRVQAMALVHQQLYDTPDLAHIDVAAYIHTLLDQLLQLDYAGTVEVELAVDPITLDTATAIPCALIINELTSNALKHAFTPGQPARLRIRCSRQGDDLLLSVSDNGVGMPPEQQHLRGNTLGLKLVATLVRQLRGRIEIVVDQGTNVSILFPANHSADGL